MPSSPLIGDRDGCVDAAAEADIVERVDDLNTGGISCDLMLVTWQEYTLGKMKV